MHEVSERMALQTVRDLIVIGAPLPFRILDAGRRLLLNGGQVVLSEAQFETLIQRGAWAERTLVEAAREAIQNGGKSPASRGQPTVFDRWEKTTLELDKLSRGIVRHTAPVSGIVPLVASIESLIDRDPDAALFVCVRQDDRRFAWYPLTHAIHCTVVSVLTARQLDWPAERTRSLACAALSMNLAMMELQAVMAEQDTPPSTRQKEQIRTHPIAAAKLLRDGGATDETWHWTIRTALRPRITRGLERPIPCDLLRASAARDGDGRRPLSHGCRVVVARRCARHSRRPVLERIGYRDEDTVDRLRRTRGARRWRSNRIARLLDPARWRPQRPCGRLGGTIVHARWPSARDRGSEPIVGTTSRA